MAGGLGRGQALGTDAASPFMKTDRRSLSVAASLTVRPDLDGHPEGGRAAHEGLRTGRGQRRRSEAGAGTGPSSATSANRAPGVGHEREVALQRGAAVFRSA